MRGMRFCIPLSAWFSLTANNLSIFLTGEWAFHHCHFRLFFDPQYWSENNAEIKAKKIEGALSAFALVGLDFVSDCGAIFGSALLIRRCPHGCPWIPT